MLKEPQLAEYRRKGRPRISNERLELVLMAIRKCYTNAEAARAVGISPTTIRKYIATGKSHIEAGLSNTPEATFVEAFERSRAKAINGLRGIIFKAAILDNDWRAADCLLKRIDPEWNLAPRAKRSQPTDRPIEASLNRIVVNMVMSEPDESAKTN
ncbi:MAG: transposase-like protein [Verrucomicrobiales bacterium]|jgi:transposase-like protein